MNRDKRELATRARRHLEEAMDLLWNTGDSTMVAIEHEIADLHRSLNAELIAAAHGGAQHNAPPTAPPDATPGAFIRPHPYAVALTGGVPKVGTCATCRHWDRSVYYPRGQCNAAIDDPTLGVWPDWSDALTEEENLTAWPDGVPRDRIFTEHVVITGPDFGCVQFEADGTG